MGYEEQALVEVHGVASVFRELTHVALAFSLFLMAVHLAIAGLKELLGRRFAIAPKSILNQLLGGVAVLGTSLAVGLFLGSALLLSGTNGSFNGEFRDNLPQRSIVAFVLGHFLPVLAWLPLYACRCEAQLIGSYARATMYLLVLPVLVLVYAFVLSLVDESAPAIAVIETAPTLVAAVAAVVAWLVGGFV